MPETASDNVFCWDSPPEIPKESASRCRTKVKGRWPELQKWDKKQQFFQVVDRTESSASDMSVQNSDPAKALAFGDVKDIDMWLAAVRLAGMRESESENEEIE